MIRTLVTIAWALAFIFLAAGYVNQKYFDASWGKKENSFSEGNSRLQPRLEVLH